MTITITAVFKAWIKDDGKREYASEVIVEGVDLDKGLNTDEQQKVKARSAELMKLQEEAVASSILLSKQQASPPPETPSPAKKTAEGMETPAPGEKLNSVAPPAAPVEKTGIRNVAPPPEKGPNAPINGGQISALRDRMLSSFKESSHIASWIEDHKIKDGDMKNMTFDQANELLTDLGKKFPAKKR